MSQSVTTQQYMLIYVVLEDTIFASEITILYIRIESKVGENL